MWFSTVFLFCIFDSPGNVYRAQCLINVNYQSLAGEELVLLQDKLLDPKTILHSMTSENGEIKLILVLVCNVSKQFNEIFSVLFSYIVGS